MILEGLWNFGGGFEHLQPPPPVTPLDYTDVNMTSIDINKNMDQRLRMLYLPAVKQHVRKRRHNRHNPGFISCSKRDSKYVYVNMQLAFAKIL